MVISMKLKIYISFDLKTPLLAIFLQIYSQMCACLHFKDLSSNTVIARGWKYSECPSKGTR